MRRFFIPESAISGNTARITDSDAHHLAHVLRKAPGDTFGATDGMGNVLTVRVNRVDDGTVLLDIIDIENMPERSVRLRLFQAIPRGGRFEAIIEKACELGVAEIIPLITERTVSRLSDEKSLKKRARWERLAMEVMKQVGRTTPMSIAPVIDMSGLRENLHTGAVKLMLWELEESRSLKKAIRGKDPKSEIEAVIGPEGGFTQKEVDEIKALGFEAVSLGRRVLKVETAALSAAACIFYELED